MVSESGTSVASSEAEDEQKEGEENEGGAAQQGSSATNEQSSPSSPTEMKTYLLSDVSRHASESDCWTVINGKIYDITWWGERLSKSIEGVTVGGSGSFLKFCHETGLQAHNLDYCETVTKDSHDCFGCVGLKHAEYSILNKRYSKDEYFSLKKKIIEHMYLMPYKDTRGIVQQWILNVFPVEAH